MKAADCLLKDLHEKLLVFMCKIWKWQMTVLLWCVNADMDMDTEAKKQDGTFRKCADIL